MKKTITVHTIIKNEENFIWYAIKSVVDFVDKIIIFDTGSTDKTVEIIKDLVKEYPDKINFEEKGECDKKRHTELRQEMLDKTTTDWFMILDGDEVWTKKGMEEVVGVINQNTEVECLIAPFYLCVGDVYHKYYKKGSYYFLGKTGQFALRFIKNDQGIKWAGDYNSDILIKNGSVIFKKENSLFLKNHYWHLTHLKRSSKDDNDYSSYGSRKEKLRETYFIIGRKIKDDFPEFLSGISKISFIISVINFLVWIIRIPTRNFGKNQRM